MKRYFIITILTFIGLTSYSQQIKSYEIEFESKFETKSIVDILITYSDSSKIPEKEFVIREISSPTIELLKNYSTTEIYYSKKIEIDSILEKNIIDHFKKYNYKINSTIIGYVDFDKEAKILFEQFLELEQNYLEVELEIYYRINAIKKELKSNKKLTRTDKKELKKELHILNNAKYVKVLYDKKMKIIDIKQN